VREDCLSEVPLPPFLARDALNNARTDVTGKWWRSTYRTHEPKPTSNSTQPSLLVGEYLVRLM